MITPFTIHIPEEEIRLLQQKLQTTRWPLATEIDNWSYGTHLPYLKELVAYWENDFDWRATERAINAYPNYKVNIDGCQVHFMHIKGKGKTSIPLLISHGWPGSFLEMMELIPLLTENEDFSFDLIFPSLVGFGFSSNYTASGFDSEQMAEVWYKLMQLLGYPSFGLQGGDVGAGVSTWLALRYPESVIGLHLNYISGSYYPYIGNTALTKEEKTYLDYAQKWSMKEGAYAHVQSTKPLTLSYGLNDSPVGLCAWIIEKFKSWSHPASTLEEVFSKDELLANVSLYWFTQTIFSSTKIYLENSKKPLAFGKDDFVKVPVAFAKFPFELPTPPRSFIERGFNLVRYTEMPRGGHFAAAEQPQLLANDIHAFFSSIV